MGWDGLGWGGVGWGGDTIVVSRCLRSGDVIKIEFVKLLDF